MALGQLIVRLGLDAADFTRGLTKAELDADRFSKKIDANFRSMGRFLGTLGIGAILGKFAHDTIDAAAALDDLADATGSSVENLSKLQNQAKVSGASFQQLESLVLKLSENMSKSGDGTEDAVRALQFLGVSAKDPVEALNQVAVALDKYEDGIGKVALARALFGRDGPRQLALLKDIAQAQDVAATTTTQMAQEAERLQKEVRKLEFALEGAKKGILLDFAPAMSRLLEQFTEGIRLAGGFWNSLRLFSTLPTVSSLEDAADGIAKITDRINKIEAGDGLEGITARLTGRTQSIVEDLKKQRAFLEFQLNQQLAGTKGTRPGDDLTVKPEAKFQLGVGSKAAVKGVDEIGRALETMRKMAAGAQAELEALTNGQEKLTAAEKAFIALKADDVWQQFPEWLRNAATGMYAWIASMEKEQDAIKQRNELYDKSIDDLQRQAEAEVKKREAIRQSVSDYGRQNDILRRQIAIIGQEQAAHEKLAAAIEYERLADEAKKAGDIGELARLEQLYQARLKLIDQADAANKAFEETRKQKQYLDEIGDAFGNAAEDAIAFGRSAKDVLKALEQDLLRLITRRLITQPLANFISAGLGSLFGAPSGAAPSLGGILGFAGGTNFAPGGLSLVGERGPELVNLPRGARVIPNDRMRDVGGTYVTNINVLPGATRATGMQVAAQQSRLAMASGRNL